MTFGTRNRPRSTAGALAWYRSRGPVLSLTTSLAQPLRHVQRMGHRRDTPAVSTASICATRSRIFDSSRPRAALSVRRHREAGQMGDLRNVVSR